MLTRSSSTGTGRPLVLTPQKFPPVSPATGVPPLAKRLSFGAPLTIQVPSRPGPGTPNPNKPPLSIAIPETPTSSVSPATGTATPTATPGKTVPYSSLTRSASASLFAVTAHNLKITTGAPHFFRRDSSDQATPSSCSSVSRGQPLFTPASSTGGLPTPASPGDSAEPLTPITPGSAR